MEENKVNGAGAGTSFSFSKSEAMVDVTWDETNFLGSPDDKSLVNSKTLRDLNSVLSDFKVDQKVETRQNEN